MDLKSAISTILFLGISLAGCAQEDTCKPRNFAFCLDKHRKWKCAPDGNPEKGSPAYTIQIVDCRTLGNGGAPYCVTLLSEDNQREGTYCLDDPNWPSGDQNDVRHDAGRDIESDSH